jgi:hypothetical protein
MGDLVSSSRHQFTALVAFDKLISNRAFNTAISISLIFSLIRNRHYTGFGIIRKLASICGPTPRKRRRESRSRIAGSRNIGSRAREQHRDEEKDIITEPLVLQPQSPTPTHGAYTDPSAHLAFTLSGEGAGYRAPTFKDEASTPLVSPSPTLVGHQEGTPDYDPQSEPYHPIYAHFVGSSSRGREPPSVHGSSDSAPPLPSNPHRETLPHPVSGAEERPGLVRIEYVPRGGFLTETKWVPVESEEAIAFDRRTKPCRDEAPTWRYCE